LAITLGVAAFVTIFVLVRFALRSHRDRST
jgi:hypothetical protein